MAANVFRRCHAQVDAVRIRFLLLLAVFPLAFELFPNFLLRHSVGEMAVGIGSDLAEPHPNLLNILRRFKVHSFESIERGERPVDSIIEVEQSGIDSRFHKFNLSSAKLRSVQVGSCTARMREMPGHTDSVMAVEPTFRTHVQKRAKLIGY